MNPSPRSAAIASLETSLSQELRQLPAGDRLKVRDRHQDKRVRFRQFGFLRRPERGSNGVAEPQFRPKAPAPGDGDEFVRTPAQFLANIVDDELEVAGLAHDARQVLAQDRLGGGENDRFDPAHPFAPARGRGQVLEVEVEFAVGFAGARHRSKPVEPKRRASGQFPDRAKGDKPVEQPPRASLRQLPARF